MQPINEKIKLYAVRDFSQRLTVVMDFLRQNWKPVLLYLTYFLLPISLVQGLSLNGFMSGYMDLIGGIMENADDPPQGLLWSAVSLLGYMVLYMAGMLMMYAVVYGLMRLYEHGDGNLSNVTWSELRDDFWLSFKRSMAMMVVSFFISVALIIAVGAVMGFVLWQNPSMFAPVYMLFVICLLVGCILLGPPLSLVMPAYIFDDDATLLSSIRRGLTLGFKTWFGTVGVMFILSIIIYTASQVISMPWGIMFFVKMMFGLGLEGLDSSWTNNVFYSFVYYLMAVIQCFAGYLLSSILIIGAAYLYGHAAEKIEGVTVDNNIRNFEHL